MIAHQRCIRERQALKPCLFREEKQRLASSFASASVREIDFDTAHRVIRKYEWLANMGATQYAFGLYFGPHLAGVECFGSTAGTYVNASVAGSENAKYVITLCRGACVHWAHENAASYLISRSCDLMVAKGYRIFVAYGDPDAGELGIVYQAVSWLYCGQTTATEEFRTPDGEVKDSRSVHSYTRDRRNVIGYEYRQKCSRAEMKQRLIADGCRFFKGQPKHRYVGIYGDKRLKRKIRKALRWPVLPYPKRETAPE